MSRSKDLNTHDDMIGRFVHGFHIPDDESVGPARRIQYPLAAKITKPVSTSMWYSVSLQSG